MTKSRHLITPRGEQLAFFEAHVMEPSDGCRIWPYPLNSASYGRLTINGVLTAVHVLTCERWNGPKPSPELEAAHECGVSACWSGEHLSWKTSTENKADMIRHGTINRGARNGSARLSEDDVHDIRRRRATGESAVDLAKEYNISSAHLYAIARGVKWNWTHQNDETTGD